MSKSKNKKESQYDLEKIFKMAWETMPIKMKKELEEKDIKTIDEFFKYIVYNTTKQTQDEDIKLFDEYNEDFEDDIYFDDEFDNEADDCLLDFESLPSGLLLDAESKEYHIRIKLKDAPVDIWRELLVPSNISLELLAKMLLMAMDWNDCHLHQFSKNREFFKSPKDMNDSMMFLGLKNISLDKDANTVALCHVLHKKGDRMKFEYDFGDSWMHDIWVKGIREYSSNESPCVKLIKGKGACPPENCGGVWGYEELLELSKKKRKTSEEKERLEWYGIDKYFDPEEFDLEETQLFIEDLWNDVLKEIEARKNKSFAKN